MSKENQKTILVVDDDQDIRGMLELFLTENNFIVRTACNGQEGLKATKELLDELSLIVLDIQMPILDGITVLRMIRRLISEQALSLPIIMLTARSDEIDRIVVLDMGADDYITKPFSLDEFLARLKRILWRSSMKEQKQTPFLFQSGDLEINLRARKAFKNGVELELSFLLFDLLAVFMKNKNVALSHQRILRTIWGYERSIRTKSLKVYVRSLREIIEKDPNKPERIVTMRGMGYRFNG